MDGWDFTELVGGGKKLSDCLRGFTYQHLPRERLFTLSPVGCFYKSSAAIAVGHRGAHVIFCPASSAIKVRFDCLCRPRTLI